MFLTADYVWWILGGCVVGPIFILIIVATIIALKKRIKLASKKINAFDESAYQAYIDAFGCDNIIGVSMEMSRITVTLNDIEKVDAQKLKDLGASGVLLVGNQVKCSFKEDTESIYNSIKGSMKNE